jgi:hypothetical protein
MNEKDDFRGIAFKETKSALAKFVAAGIVSGLTAGVAAIVAVIQLLPGHVGLVPSGTVAPYWTSAATDQTDAHCPAGWRPLEEARGRLIVGAGVPSHSSARYWATGKILETRAPQAIGGQPEIVLTKDQMPQHSHPVRHPLAHGAPGVGYSGGGSGIIDGRTEPEGRGDPIKVDPPFLAIYYCVKR